MDFDKSAKAMQCKKDSLFNKWCQGNWTSTGKREKERTVLYMKVKSKMDHILKGKAVKVLEINIGKNLQNLGLGKES